MNSPSSPPVKPSRVRGAPSRGSQNDTPGLPRAAESGRSILLVVMAVGLLVVLPVLFKWIAAEADRWRVASVAERYLDGEDRQQAIAELQSLSNELPADHRVKQRLANWLFEEEKAEQALLVLKQIPESRRGERYLNLRINCLVASGQPGIALKAYRNANPASAVRSPQEQAIHKNRLAYYSALASEDLPLSLSNINSVIDKQATWFVGQLALPLPTEKQTLFCAALLYRDKANRVELDQTVRTQAAAQALKITSEIIPKLRENYLFWCPDTDAIENSQSPTGSLKEGARQDDQTAEIADEDKVREENNALQRDAAASILALFYSLRAVIYQDLGQFEKSKADRHSVCGLGFMPEEVAKRFPTFRVAATHLRTMAELLDTRGCIQFKSGKLAEANRDFFVAIVAQQSLVDVAGYLDRTSIDYGISLDPRQQRERYVRLPERSLAVMLFHRSWVMSTYGRQQVSEPQQPAANQSSSQSAPKIRFVLKIQYLTQAADDIAKIKELGFRPGHYLF